MNNDVTCGNDGWIFLTGGSNDVLKSYSGNYNSLAWARAWSERLTERKSYFSEHGVKYFHIVAPEKISIYSQYLPESTRQKLCLHETPSLKVSNLIGDKDILINPSEYLRRLSEKFQVYHKTDSHWNFYGAFGVYQLLMAKLGLDFDESILLNIPKHQMVTLDLGGKFKPKIKESALFYSPRPRVSRVWCNQLVEYKERSGKENVAGLHIGSSVIFSNSDAVHQKRVIIFGDSFSEYRPQLITGLLSETFSNVMFVWSQNIDFDVIKEFSPEIVITETAERFMPYSVPNDNFNLCDFVNNKLVSLGVI